MNKVELFGWQPGIGDPGMMGWLIVVCYFMAALLSFLVYLKADEQHFGNARLYLYQKRFWLSLALLLCVLCVNKQLDLQSLLTAIGKYYAHEHGWYEQRRHIQMFIIIALLSTAVFTFVFFVTKLGRLVKINWLAILGVVFLLVFIIIRATSFHRMDIIINSTAFGLRMNWILELSGILAICISALNQLRRV